MSFITRNIVVIFVALLTASLGWVFGGIRGSLLPNFVPWLWAFLFEAMICFPQRHAEETPHMARERAWEDMRQDPLVWIGCGFLILMAIPFVNTGLCPVCDYPQIVAGASPKPPVPYLPFCVNRSEHFHVFLWFLAAITAMIAVKHCLVKSGKRLLIEILVWNGVALGALGLVQQGFGAPGPLWQPLRQASNLDFFSTFGYANMAGSYFSSLFILALGLWRRRLDETRAEDRVHTTNDDTKEIAERDRFWHRHYLMIPAAILYIAALNTYSRAAILISSLAAILIFAHTAVMTLARMERARRVKTSALFVLLIIAIAVLATVFTPKRIRSEINSLGATEVINRVGGRSEYHSQLAVDLLWENPLFGCGGWGYKHFSAPRVPETVSKWWKYSWSVGGANVHNDYLQFLCEHGIVGFACLASMFLLLLTPVAKLWKALARSVRFSHIPGLPRPRGFFIFPAAAFAILLAIATTLIHAFGDCPLRSPAILTLLFIELAALDGFLPKMITKERN